MHPQRVGDKSYRKMKVLRETQKYPERGVKGTSLRNRREKGVNVRKPYSTFYILQRLGKIQLIICPKK